MTERNFKGDIKTQLIGSILQAFMVLCASVFIGRVLGPEGRGLLALAILIPDFLSRILILGQDAVNNTFAGLYPDRRKTLFLQSLSTCLIATVLSILFLLLFFFWLPIPLGRFEDVSTKMILLGMVIIPSYLLFRSLMSLALGCKHIDWAVQIQLTQSISYLLLLGILFLQNRFTVMTVMIGIAVSHFLAISWSFWKLKEYTTLLRKDFSFSFLRKSLRFGSQISASVIAHIMLLRLDQLILAYMVLKEQIGQYAIAVVLAESLRILPNAVSISFLPRLTNEAAERRSQVPFVFRLTCLISVASTFLVGIFGFFAIYFLFGSRFHGAILPFLILLPGLAVQGASAILANDLVAREKPFYSIIIGYSMVILNVLLNIILIKKLGISGAALASLIAYSCAGILWIWFYCRESGNSFNMLRIQKQDIIYLTQSLKESFIRNLRTFHKKNTNHEAH